MQDKNARATGGASLESVSAISESKRVQTEHGVEDTSEDETTIHHPPDQTWSLPMNPSNEHSPLERIPTDLRDRPQWVVWRYGEMQANGKRKKPIYSPVTGGPAKTNDPSTHGTFEQAVWKVVMGGFQGLGFVLDQSDPFTCIDLDHCRDAKTGAITPQAEQIIRRFDSYIEVSPSGEGVHIWVYGALPGPNKGPGNIAEVYDHAHYLTVTGDHLEGTPSTIKGRQEELTAWYAETFGLPTKSTGSDSISPFPSDLDDARLIEKALASDANLRDLWAGDPSAFTHPDGTVDHSRADMALCGRLAFWTGKDAERMDRLFRQSGLYALPDRAEKWDRVHFGDGRTYCEATIDRAIAEQTTVYTPGKRTDRRVIHPHPWQQTSETPRERKARVYRVQGNIETQARAHLVQGGDELLVIAAPPGSGKTYAAARIGVDLDVAYIAERHDHADDVDDLTTYRHIRPPNATNCLHFEEHADWVKKGYDTLAWHLGHGCDYGKQFLGEGSAFYMVEHVPTPHPARHANGVVIDEMNLTKWLPERTFSADDLRAAGIASPAKSTQERLLRGH